MRLIVSRILILSLGLTSLTSLAQTDYAELDIKLYAAVYNNNFQAFKQQLLAGANPMGQTKKGGFHSTALCRSTAKGAEQF